MTNLNWPFFSKMIETLVTTEVSTHLTHIYLWPNELFQSCFCLQQSHEVAQVNFRDHLHMAADSPSWGPTRSTNHNRVIPPIRVQDVNNSGIADTAFNMFYNIIKYST